MEKIFKLFLKPDHMTDRKKFIICISYVSAKWPVRSGIECSSNAICLRYVFSSEKQNRNTRSALFYSKLLNSTYDLMQCYCGNCVCRSACEFLQIKFCIYITYLCLMTSLFFTDECCVDQIDELNRFPYQICVSHYRGHPIICVSQLPDIVWPRANLWFSNWHSIDKNMMYVYVLIY